MTVVQDFLSVSVLTKVSFILLAISSLFTTIAFTCTGWGENGLGEHWGLWRKCGDSNFDTSGCVPLDGWANDWWAFTQASVIFGLFGTLSSFVLVVLYIFVDKYKRNPTVVTVGACISVATGLLYMIGCVVFGVFWDRYYYDRVIGPGVVIEYWLSYAFGLSLVAFVLEIAAGICLLLERKLGAIKPSTAESPS